MAEHSVKIKNNNLYKRSAEVAINGIHSNENRWSLWWKVPLVAATSPAYQVNRLSGQGHQRPIGVEILKGSLRPAVDIEELMV